MDRTLALAVDDVVDGPGVVPVEHAGVQEVLPEEGLVRHLGHPVLAVAADDDDFRQVGTLGDELSAVGILEADAHEALGEVRVQLRVVVHDLGRGDGLEGGDLRQARVVLSVFLLQGFEPVDGVFGQVREIVPHVLHLVLQGVDLLVQGLGVELGNLAHRLLHEFQDVVHHDFAVEKVLVLLHLGEDVLQLLVPVALVLLQHLVDAVLEEDALQGVVVPLVLQLAEFDLQFPAQQVAGVHGVILEDVVD